MKKSLVLIAGKKWLVALLLIAVTTLYMGLTAFAQVNRGFSNAAVPYEKSEISYGDVYEFSQNSYQASYYSIVNNEEGLAYSNTNKQQSKADYESSKVDAGEKKTVSFYGVFEANEIPSTPENQTFSTIIVDSSPLKAHEFAQFSKNNCFEEVKTATGYTIPVYGSSSSEQDSTYTVAPGSVGLYRIYVYSPAAAPTADSASYALLDSYNALCGEQLPYEAELTYTSVGNGWYYTEVSVDVMRWSGFYIQNTVLEDENSLPSNSGIKVTGSRYEEPNCLLGDSDKYRVNSWTATEIFFDTLLTVKWNSSVKLGPITKVDSFSIENPAASCGTIDKISNIFGEEIDASAVAGTAHAPVYITVTPAEGYVCAGITKADGSYLECVINENSSYTYRYDFEGGGLSIKWAEKRTLPVVTVTEVTPNSEERRVGDLNFQDTAALTDYPTRGAAIQYRISVSFPAGTEDMAVQYSFEPFAEGSYLPSAQANVLAATEKADSDFEQGIPILEAETPDDTTADEGTPQSQQKSGEAPDETVVEDAEGISSATDESSIAEEISTAENFVEGVAPENQNKDDNSEKDPEQLLPQASMPNAQIGTSASLTADHPSECITVGLDKCTLYFRAISTTGAMYGASFTAIPTYTHKSDTDDAEARIGEFYYQYIEDALTDAKSGCTVVMLRDCTVSAKTAEGSSSADLLSKDWQCDANGDGSPDGYTVKSGVTLLIPYDEEETLFLDSPTAAPVGKSVSTAQNEHRRLTLTEGATLTLAGNLSVGGQYSASGGSYIGNMSGNYGQVWLDAGSSIIVENGGNLYAWGFVSGTGSVTVKSGGTAYEWYQITDFRGGTASTNIENKVFPFSQYYVQNIESALTLEQGASEKAYAAVYALGKIYYSMIPFVGDNGMFKVVSGSLTKRYDGASDRMIYTINGQAEVNTLNLSLAGMKVSSAEYVLPLTNNMTVELAENSKLTINQTAALLPGVRVQIARDAELVISGGNSIYVYDRDEWVEDNYTFHGNYFVPIQYSPSKTYSRQESDLVDAKIDVNGNITVNGAMYTTENGADICSSEGTGKYIQQDNDPGEETETWQYTQGANSAVTPHRIPITPAKLHNADGTYTETTGIPANTTINYFMGKWGGITVTYNANYTTDESTEEVTDPVTYNGEDRDVRLKDADASTFSRLGYTLTSWNTTPGGSGTSYSLGAKVAETSLTDGATLYAQWTEKTYTITVKSDANGSSIADVSLDGPGTGYKITEWGSDKQITIIAPEKQGFTFKGWHKEAENYDGNSLSPDLVVKKSLTDLLDAGMADDKNVISLVAVYESKEETNLTLTLNNAPDNTSVTGGDPIGDSGNVWSVPVGTEVTITVNDANFQYWTNANDKVMSKETEYTFTMVTNTTLTAETSSDDTFIFFQSADGRLLKYTTTNNLSANDVPAAPYRVGYEFKGWKVNGADPVSADKVVEELTGKTGTVTVTAAYEELTGAEYTVTAKQAVNGVVGAAISGEKSTYALGEIATLTADPTANNKTFRFWASDAKGANILSFSTTYSFRVTKGTTIYAIYGDKVTDKPPVVRVDDVLAKNENSVNSLTFMIGANIPTGYELVEMGALYAKNSGDDTTLRVENVGSSNGVYKAVSRLKHDATLTDYSYALGFKISEDSANTTIHLRGYVAVRKASDNTIYYYYSGVTSKSYNGVNTQQGG